MTIAQASRVFARNPRRTAG